VLLGTGVPGSEGRLTGLIMQQPAGAGWAPLAPAAPNLWPRDGRVSEGGCRERGDAQRTIQVLQLRAAEERSRVYCGTKETVHCSAQPHPLGSRTGAGASTDTATGTGACPGTCHGGSHSCAHWQGQLQGQVQLQGQMQGRGGPRAGAVTAAGVCPCAGGGTGAGGTRPVAQAHQERDRGVRCPPNAAHGSGRGGLRSSFQCTSHWAWVSQSQSVTTPVPAGLGR